MKEPESAQLKSDYSKLDIEQQKLALEYEKLKLERFKAIWTGISIFIPLLIAVGTIFFNAKNQAEQAQIDFQLKAAEIVMNSSGPSEAKGKAEAMVALFPDYIPADFAKSFVPLDYGSSKISASQKALLDLIVEHPDQRNEIIDMWLAVAPYDTWAENLRE